ncbi:hypothetical protein Aduo_014891 [Ancylostoma duodenale]
MMNLRERIKLVIRQAPRIVFLMISFWTFQQECDGIFMGCGLRIKPERNQDELTGDLLNALATFIHTHIITTFRKINITREEYLLLKAVALFEVLDEYFPPADRLIMDTALNKYRSALVDCMKRSHPELEHETLLERLQTLLGTLTYLEVLRDFDNRFMADVVIRNNGDMRGRLTIEILVDSNRMD